MTSAGVDRLLRFGCDERMAADAGELGGDLDRRQHEIDGSRRDCAARHAGLLGSVVLGESHSTRRLDFLNADRSVGARTRQHDADRLLALIIRKRLEIVIDRPVLSGRGPARSELQGAAMDFQIMTGRQHVHMVAFDANPIANRCDGDGGNASDNFGEHAFMARRQVQDKHVGHAGIGCEPLRKLLGRLESAGGRADPHDAERQRSGVAAVRDRVRDASAAGVLCGAHGVDSGATE